MQDAIKFHESHVKVNLKEYLSHQTIERCSSRITYSKHKITNDFTPRVRFPLDMSAFFGPGSLFFKNRRL